MDYYQFKSELYTVLFFLVFPVGIPTLAYFVKRKFLWVSPVLSLILGLILTVVFYPYYFTDTINNTIDSTTAYWLYFGIPIHVAVSVIVMSIFYAVKHFRDNRKAE